MCSPSMATLAATPKFRKTSGRPPLLDTRAQTLALSPAPQVRRLPSDGFTKSAEDSIPRYRTHGTTVQFSQSPLQKSEGLSFHATSGGVGVEEVVGGVGYKRLMTDVI